jgi:hypothetical protein
MILFATLNEDHNAKNREKSTGHKLRVGMK